MRHVIVLLAMVGLSACGSQPDQVTPPVVKAALTFDGADATSPAAQIAHGERLTWLLGCRGCHAPNLQGANVTSDEPSFGDMNAPNLTLLAPKYDDADFDRLFRHGVPKDGREMWFMPSEMLQFASDQDLAALIAYLRTLEPAGKKMPAIRKGRLFDKQVVSGEFTSAPGMIKRFRAAQPTDLGQAHALGRYIATTSCTECHNNQLQGLPDFTPNLDIAGSYTPAELTHLLTTGEGKAKKDLGLMSDTARHRYAKLTPRERDALVGYLIARANRPAGTN